MEHRSTVTVVMLKCLFIMGIGIAIMDALPAIMSIDPASNVEELNPSGTNKSRSTSNATILEEFIYESLTPEGLNNTNYSATAIGPDISASPPSVGSPSASLMPWTPFRGLSDLHLTTVTLKKSTSKALTETIVTAEPKAGGGGDQAAGYSSWFVLMLDGNCSLEGDDLDNLKERLAGELAARLQLKERSLAVRDTSCSSADQMHINVTIHEPRANLSALLATDNDPSSGSPLVRIKHHDYYVHQVLTADGFLLRVEPDLMVPVDMRHTDVELIVYIAVGSACAFLVLLVAGLLTFKYCDRSSKPGGGDFFDYRDVLACSGHLQSMHRLEDYTLTRIPRPKLSCIDYCKGMSSSGGGRDGKRYSPLDEKMAEAPHSGMVRPSDTSVVPLEDAFPGDSTLQGQGGSDGVIVRPMDIRRYAGQNFTRFYGNGRGMRSPAAAAGGAGADAAGRSTENLQQPDADNLTLDHGLDNPIYH